MINYRKDPRQRSKKVAENEEDHRALRWEDCVKRDLIKAEEEEKWKCQQHGAMETNHKSSRPSIGWS